MIAPRDTLLQHATPVDAHGRVLAVDSSLRSWAQVIALPLAALFVTVSSVPATACLFACMPVLGLFVTRHAGASSSPAHTRKMLHAKMPVS